MSDAALLIAAAARRGWTVATCESLTAGGIGAEITTVPGSSQVYRGGLITYAPDLKATLAGVDAEMINREGVVNSATAAQMAEGAARACGADVAIAVTGVAGPGPEAGHAAGEVWIGIHTPAGTTTTRHDFPGDRDEVRRQTVATALRELCSRLGE